MYRNTTIKNLKPFFDFSLLLLILLTASRLGLAFWQLERFDDVTVYFKLLIGGLRIDLTTIAYLCLFPALLHPWFINSNMACHWKKVLQAWFFLTLVIVLFFELATPAFIIEYGLRPNRLFIEYLAYPSEVFQMLVNGHALMLTIVVILLVLPMRFIWRVVNRIVSRVPIDNRVNLLSKAVSFLVAVLLLALIGRGTLGHRPLNPSLVYFATDPLVNSLTLNSIYSVGYALNQLGDEKNASKLYGKMNQERILELVREGTRLPKSRFKDPNLPTMVKREPYYSGQPKNLVIILEESLGAQYVASLGGIPLTPEIDKLYSEGWSFDRLYATGTRSVRGIEAVITGYTPTPSRAVVKLDKSQTDFFTIASLLSKKGYETQFIYGGESHFDNMKSFFLGNGFNDIVDFDDIDKPQFVASWGASDQDLFNQADKELLKLHAQAKPFFSFVFTSSNHDPFEIPAGIVSPIAYTNEQLKLYDDKELLRHKAIQYADYALGQFITKAKKQPYWKDTIFLIVSDHDARAMGSDLVPINNFHIPGVILNSTAKSERDTRVVSQIDLAPTLLSLMGVENQSPMLGHDLNDSSSSGRAMMQYAENFAYMLNDKVTILQPSKQPLNFAYDYEENRLIPGPEDAILSELALAHVLWGSLAYEKQWYSNYKISEAQGNNNHISSVKEYPSNRE